MNWRRAGVVAAFALFALSAAHAGDCRKLAQVCTDGPGTKNIGGVDLWRPCWSFIDTYECVDPDSTNYCAGVQAAGCSETSSVCAATAFNGTCTSQTKTYRCGNAVAPAAGVITLDATYTVIQDLQDYSQCAALSTNPSCQKIGQVCISGPGTRNISGLDVYRDCWEWRDDWACTAADYVDYCQPLKSIGCQPQGAPTCVEWAPNGTCNRNEWTFACTNQPPQVAPNVVSLSTSYTIISDALNTSACDTLAANPSCRLAGQRCVEGPETRNINGFDVYRDCWRFEQDHVCQVGNPINYCLPLESTPGCSEVGTPTCVENSVTNACNAQQRTYRCDGKQGDPLPQNVVFLNNEYTIVSETIVNECVNLENNPNCVVAESTCVEGPETRNINGLDVYRACWKTEKRYVCSDPTLSQNDCGALENDPKCQLGDEKCTHVNDITNQCSVRTRTYTCEDKPQDQVTEQVCGTSLCIAGVCAPADGPPDDGFADAIVGLEVGRQAGVYGDYSNGTFFNGSRDDCSKKLFGAYSCCKPKVDGTTPNSSMGVAYEFGQQAGKEAIQYLGSSYAHDILFNSGAPDALVNALYGAGGGASFSASFSFYGITYDLGANLFAFDPYSFAVAVAVKILTEYLSCSQQEQILSLKKGVNLCHYVGTYCDKKILGSCIEKKESYCCFNSKLARIIHEGGRPQLGLGWGSPENPSCTGFTQAQIETIDFSQIDFSEFVRDIQAKAFNGGAATARAEDRAKDIKTMGSSYFAMPPPSGKVCTKPPC